MAKARKVQAKFARTSKSIGVISNKPASTKERAKAAQKSLTEAKGKKGTKIALAATGKPKGTKTIERELGTKVKDIFNPAYIGASFTYGATTKEKVPAYSNKQKAQAKLIKQQMITERGRTATRAAAKAKKSK